MDLTTWGRSSGFCVDPVEKKPLFHFLPGTPTFSFGTAGCNLGCRFCQNWPTTKARAFDAGTDTAGPDAIVAAALRTGCRSVAFTYNDPVIFAEYAIDTARACLGAGLRTVAKTAGYIAAGARPEFFGAMDAANVDLKAFTERFYRQLCFGRLEPVKETLAWLAKQPHVWLELTTLLIPGENDGDDEIQALSEWVATALSPDVPLHFTAYHPDYKLQRPATPPTTLRRARQTALDVGLRYVYVGNVHDPKAESTRCPGCDGLLVGRRGYEITGWGLRDGACARCGRAIPGRFEARPGSWGARRMPVRIDA
jgi:pyruvate formate lyase activating enzyme